MSVFEIPRSRLVGCLHCASKLDSNGKGTWRRVKGWAPIARSSNNRVGTNALALPTFDFVFACEDCIDKMKKGIPVGQLSLLEHGSCRCNEPVLERIPAFNAVQCRKCGMPVA